MRGHALFPPTADSGSGREPNCQLEETAVAARHIRVERSALWAAYGDALGWISELTDERGLARRTLGKPLIRPIRWKRRIGGWTGITASLPEGCYSDDSQLRLATGRAIGPDRFDIEAFSKVELPVWLSYALGGGRATGRAAANLARPKVPWFANQFKGWINSGGNGAAMRVQPHVWAAATLENPESFLLDVVRNTVCTHSHPTGIMGAVLHSLTLARAMATGRCPTPNYLFQAVDIAATLPEMIRNDTEIGNYWLGGFQREAGSFDEGWSRAVAESREAIYTASVSVKDGAPESSYAELAERLGLRVAEQRGSGILTAVAATALTWCDSPPHEALRVAANAVGTDTDTIATMAGAILGATSEAGPPVDVMDVDLFRSEAARLSKIAHGGQPQGHDYPDLLYWSPPRGRSDSLASLDDGRLRVRGLGRASVIDQPIQSPNKKFQWQWLRLELGQTVLIKSRPELERGREDQSESQRGPLGNGKREADSQVRSPRRMRHEEVSDRHAARGSRQKEQARASRRSKGLDLRSALEFVAARRNDDRIVGRALRRVVNEGTPAEIAGFTSGLVDLLRQSERGRPSLQYQSRNASNEGRSPHSDAKDEL